jgi:hypothetical protein
VASVVLFFRFDLVLHSFTRLSHEAGCLRIILIYSITTHS